MISISNCLNLNPAAPGGAGGTLHNHHHLVKENEGRGGLLEVAPTEALQEKEKQTEGLVIRNSGPDGVPPASSLIHIELRRGTVVSVCSVVVCLAPSAAEVCMASLCGNWPAQRLFPVEYCVLQGVTILWKGFVAACDAYSGVEAQEVLAGKRKPYALGGVPEDCYGYGCRHTWWGRQCRRVFFWTMHHHNFGVKSGSSPVLEAAGLLGADRMDHRLVSCLAARNLGNSTVSSPKALVTPSG